MNRNHKNFGGASSGQAPAFPGRRQCLQWLAAGIALAGTPLGRAAISSPEQASQGGAVTLRVAAIQMVPKLGDVDANLAQAEQLVREAVRMGAEWIVLPEMFTSAVAFHPNTVRAIRPMDAAPAALLKDLARTHLVTLSGSFLAHDGDQVVNAFLLAFPDGSTQRHDKDFPHLLGNLLLPGRR